MKKRMREDESKQEIELNMSMGDLCRGWFSNRMLPLLGMIQFIHERDERAKVRAEFFLEDIEHHFINSQRPRSLENAFRYLRFYLQAYPNVSLENSRRAVEMVKRIYQALGLKLEQKFEPKLSTEEKLRRVVCECTQNRNALQEVSRTKQNEAENE